MIKCLLFILIFTVWTLFVVMCIDINRFVTKEYTIYSDRIKDKLDIVLLADMHNKEFGRDNYKLIKAIKDFEPDIICCVGDMMTAKKDGYSKAVSLFSYLKEYPIYYSLGNHEYHTKIYPERHGDTYDVYTEKIKELGVHVLENDHIDLADRKIRMQGLMIDEKYYKKTVKAQMSSQYVTDLTGMDGSEYTILLAHNPEYFEQYAQAGADLVFAGHVHGGLMRLPVLGGVISPKLKLFPKYDGGIFTHDNSQMVLSRGLGYHTLPLRIFNPGELICVHLLPCKD